MEDGSLEGLLWRGKRGDCLKVGDKISIEIVETEEVDVPSFRGISKRREQDSGDNS